jgi:hypothetical protein
MGRKVWKWWLWFTMGIWGAGLVVHVLAGNWWSVLMEASLIALGILQLRDLDRRCVDCQRSHEEVMASRRAE